MRYLTWFNFIKFSLFLFSIPVYYCGFYTTGFWMFIIFCCMWGKAWEELDGSIIKEKVEKKPLKARMINSLPFFGILSFISFFILLFFGLYNRNEILNLLALFCIALGWFLFYTYTDFYETQR